ncbi:Obg family GTPase CgtA, partial [Eggerthella sinensis]
FKVLPLGGGVFRVEGPQVERMVVQTDWENEEAIAFLQHRLKRLGVEKALEKAGAVDGDEIRIVGRAFEFESVRTADDLFKELDL